jgi:hypothetical protein
MRGTCEQFKVIQSKTQVTDSEGNPVTVLPDIFISQLEGIMERARLVTDQVMLTPEVAKTHSTIDRQIRDLQKQVRLFDFALCLAHHSPHG